MSKRIIVVDDDAMNLKMANFILAKGGFEITALSSGRHCIEELKKSSAEDIGLILLDIEMPVMNGFQTFEQIGAMEGFGNIPVMFLTSSSDGADIEKAKQMGAADFISKPFVPKALLDRVTNALK